MTRPLSRPGEPPCHALERRFWCDWKGPGDFMGHVCYPPKKKVVSRERLQRLAFETYGHERQLLQLAEELSEASAAIMRFMNGKASAQPVVEEIVDVESVIGSLRDYLADGVLWENTRKAKAQKLAFVLGVEVDVS